MSDTKVFNKIFLRLKVLIAISTFSNSCFISFLPNDLMENCLPPLATQFSKMFALGVIKKTCETVSKRTIKYFDLLLSNVSARA